MLCDGLETLRPVIEGRFGILSTTYEEYTPDQQGKEGANRPGQTSPAGSNEAFRIVEYGAFGCVARVYAGRVGVGTIEDDSGWLRAHAACWRSPMQTCSRGGTQFLGAVRSRLWQKWIHLNTDKEP